MYNSRLAELFNEIADMLSLDDKVDRKFEVLAYRKAAMTIESMQEDVGDIYKKKGVEGLMELSGIGKGIAGSIREYIDTGKMEKYERLKKQYPIDFKELTKISGLGAKKAYKLYAALKIRNVEDLKKAIARHRISDLEGFGKKSEEELSKGIALQESAKGRLDIGMALPEAESMVRKLKESGIVQRVAIAGSTRRMKETVGDLDILVTAKDAAKVMAFISKMQEVRSVMQAGPTKTTVRLNIGISCDVRVVEDRSFGAAMQYFTGNKDHNVKVRQIAIKAGYKLNEYGLFDKKNKNVAGPEEESIYKKLGMDIMDPEMREDRGEVELSLKHALPRLICINDIKGDLHVHTKASDGQNTILEMAAYAKRLGRDYIGISDHSKVQAQAGGMDDREMMVHLRNIDKAADQLDGIRLLKGAEVDILKDGSLDFSNKTMDAMDYRLCSVHNWLSMPRDEMTKRVIAAMESGYMTVFAHPTDRLINRRSPIDMDLDKVFQAAADNDVILEIDSYPERLDLNDENILKAKEYKVKFSIDTDSHRDEHLEFMRYGVSTAKRGWLTPDRVINTLSVDKLLKELGK